MKSDLPLIYLSMLVVLLALSGGLIIRQVLKTRTTELKLSKLQKRLTTSKGEPQDYYELGSILLGKKLYGQAIAALQQALKSKQLAEGEPKAMVLNALGYAYAAKEQYDIAIRHYKDALKEKPDYATAHNNLGFAYERKQLTLQALQAYEQALEIEPTNSTAKKRAESMRKRIMPTAV
jgi:tetratricopeptide (TPR) repeat protein